MPYGKLGKSLGAGMAMDDEEPSEDMSAPEPEEEPMMEEGGGDVPPDFQAAYDEWMDMPSAKSMYDMIEACKGSEKGSPGLALILGGKGKKP